jgi:uncharacterized membrane protein (DUF4010 family)
MPLMNGLWIGLSVALGCGLLIGLERERRKGEGAERQPAGVRSFTIVALTGALGAAASRSLDSVLPAGAALAAVVLLAALAYWRSPPSDPGLTTELAMVATALIGQLAMADPALAAACAVVLTGLLALREHLHRFATEWLRQEELHDGLLLAAIALVLLPLAPLQGQAWLGGLSPRSLVSGVLMLLVMQAAGHFAHRLLGERAGLALSGLFGGLVSSTATIASLGARWREGHPGGAGAASSAADERLRPLLGAAVLSTAATWLQVLVMAAVLAPGAVTVVLPPVLAGAAVALGLGGLLWQGGGRGAAPVGAPSGGPLRLKAALGISALLAGVAAGVHLGRVWLGDAGLFVSLGIAAMADAHAPVNTLLSLHAGDQIDGRHLVQGVLLAISVNSVTRAIVAVASGGPRFGAGVAAALAAGTSAAWATVLLLTRP